MKFSTLANLNRRAISGAVNPDAFALAHERAANEAIDQKFEFDAVDQRDVNAWLQEQIKDANLQDVEFFESKAEQTELYFADLKSITDDLDEKSRQQLEALQKTQQQRQEAIAKHVQQQKENLAKAIQEKREADKRLAESKAALAQLAQQHRTLMQEHIAAAQQVFERQQAMKAFEPQAQQSAENIRQHVAQGAQNPFDYKGSVFDHPGKYALDRDRAFQKKLETMGDSARQARDPDVRERIEIEMQRQKASYAGQQNAKIAGLTGQSRDGAIAMHEEAEKAAAARALELDKQLEARGIKVDFSQGAAPDVRAIQEHEKLGNRFDADMSNVAEQKNRVASVEEAKENEETIRNQLNDHDRAMSTAESATQQAATESDTKTRMFEKLQSRAQRHALENKGKQLPDVSRHIEAARKRNEDMERNRELQQQQQQKSASLGMR